MDNGRRSTGGRGCHTHIGGQQHTDRQCRRIGAAGDAHTVGDGRQHGCGGDVISHVGEGHTHDTHYCGEDERALALDHRRDQLHQPGRDSGGLGGHGIGDTQRGGQDEDDGPANVLGEQLDGRHALLQTDHDIDADSAQQDAGGAHIVQHRTDNKGLGHEGGEQQQDDHGHKEDHDKFLIPAQLGQLFHGFVAGGNYADIAPEDKFHQHQQQGHGNSGDDDHDRQIGDKRDGVAAGHLGIAGEHHGGQRLERQQHVEGAAHTDCAHQGDRGPLAAGLNAVEAADLLDQGENYHGGRSAGNHDDQRAHG